MDRRCFSVCAVILAGQPEKCCPRNQREPRHGQVCQTVVNIKRYLRVLRKLLSIPIYDCFFKVLRIKDYIATTTNYFNECYTSSGSPKPSSRYTPTLSSHLAVGLSPPSFSLPLLQHALNTMWRWTIFLRCTLPCYKGDLLLVRRHFHTSFFHLMTRIINFV